MEPSANETLQTAEKKLEKRVGPPHRWKKGQSGNPFGRAKGHRIERTLLQEALRLVESDTKTICSCQFRQNGKRIPGKKRCATVREHFIRRSLAVENVLPALMRKLDPDLERQMGDPIRVINVIYPKYWNGGDDSSIRSESVDGANVPAAQNAT